MSALPPKADIRTWPYHLGVRPSKAEIGAQPTCCGTPEVGAGGKKATARPRSPRSALLRLRSTVWPHWQVIMQIALADFPSGVHEILLACNGCNFAFGRCGRHRQRDHI